MRPNLSLRWELSSTQASPLTLPPGPYTCPSPHLTTWLPLPMVRAKLPIRLRKERWSRSPWEYVLSRLGNHCICYIINLKPSSHWSTGFLPGQVSFWPQHTHSPQAEPSEQRVRTSSGQRIRNSSQNVTNFKWIVRVRISRVIRWRRWDALARRRTQI